jgi:hypothetical protein
VRAAISKPSEWNFRPSARTNLKALIELGLVEMHDDAHPCQCRSSDNKGAVPELTRSADIKLN